MLMDTYIHTYIHKLLVNQFTAAGDHLTIARYMLMRIGEMFGYVVSFDPKPIPGERALYICLYQVSMHCTYAYTR